MKTRQLASPAYAFSLVVLAASPASAEFQCAPADTTITFPENDAFFGREVGEWSKTTARRYLEGSGLCVDVVVPGYEGFPTKRCSYTAVDAGAPVFPPLAAEVIVLNPSARQLAAWSVSACRVNGANDADMDECLGNLRNHIINQNGAQFAVAGSVVESRCNSSRDYPSGCKGLKADNEGRRPRNTWFRDGVSVDYKAAQGVRWDTRAYSKATFDAVLDVSKSDSNLDSAYSIARVAAATREQWAAWRTAQGKSPMPDNAQGTTAGHGWRTVAASVHKVACTGTSNELFDAVVYNNRTAWLGR